MALTLAKDTLRFETMQRMNAATGKAVLFGRFASDPDIEYTLAQRIALFDLAVLDGDDAVAEVRAIERESPYHLSIQALLAQKLWESRRYEESFAVWIAAYEEASEVIPASFKGRMDWNEPGNRQFLCVARGAMNAFMQHFGDFDSAVQMAQQLLKWGPEGCIDAQIILGRVNLKNGDLSQAMKWSLKTVGPFPLEWYQVALICFLQGHYVQALTSARIGIAHNPYVAEILTGRMEPQPHFYWHGTELGMPDTADAYVSGAIDLWPSAAFDFLDWAFNSSLVLQDRATWMRLHERLTYERNNDQKLLIIDELARFVGGIDDSTSQQVVAQVPSESGALVWPWDRVFRPFSPAFSV